MTVCLPFSFAFTYHALVGVASGARPSAIDSAMAEPASFAVGERGHAKTAESASQLADAGEEVGTGGFKKSWIRGGPGLSCDDVCEDLGGCAFKSGEEDNNLLPQKSEAMERKALKAGLTCSSTEERCDKEAPLFKLDEGQKANAENVTGTCYYCKTRDDTIGSCSNQGGPRLCACGGVTWVRGGPGLSCDDVCEDRGGCVGDNSDPDQYNVMPQTSKVMEKRALKAKLHCSSTEERCDMGEAPLFELDDAVKDANAETVTGKCYYCRTKSGANEWRANYMGKCKNKYGERTRLCPCDH